MGDEVVDADGNTWHAGYLDAPANFSDTINAARHGNLSQIQGGGCRISNHGSLWSEVKAQGASLQNSSLEKVVGIAPGTTPATRWTGVVRKAYPEGGVIVLAGESVRGARHREIPQKIVNDDAFPLARSADRGKPLPIVLGKVPKVPARAIEFDRRGRSWWDRSDGRAESGGFAISLYDDLVAEGLTEAQELARVQSVSAKSLRYWTGLLAPGQSSSADNSGRHAVAAPYCHDGESNYPYPDYAPTDLYLEVVRGNATGRVIRVGSVQDVSGDLAFACQIELASMAREMPEPGDHIRLFRQRVRFAAHDSVYTKAFNHASGSAVDDRLYALINGEYVALPTVAVRSGLVTAGSQIVGGWSLDSDIYRDESFAGRYFVAPERIHLRWVQSPADPFSSTGAPGDLIDGDLNTMYAWQGGAETLATLRLRLTLPDLASVGTSDFDRAYFCFKGQSWNDTPSTVLRPRITVRALDFTGATLATLYDASPIPLGLSFNLNNFPAASPWTNGPANDDGYYTYPLGLSGLTREMWDVLGALEIDLLYTPDDYSGTMQYGNIAGVAVVLEVDTNLSSDDYATDLIGRMPSAPGWVQRLGSQPSPPMGAYIETAPHQIEDILIEELGLASRATADLSGQVDAGSVESCLFDLLTNAGADSADAAEAAVCVHETGTKSDAVIGWYCKDWGIVEVQDHLGREVLRALYRGARSDTYEYTLSDTGPMEKRYVEGSLMRLGQTSIEDVVNCPTFRYSYDPTKQDYTASCGFAHLDADAFPAATADWKAYASGFGDDYAYARRAWEILRSSVRRTGRIAAATIDCRTVYDAWNLRRILLPPYGVGHLEWMSTQKDVFRCRVPEDHALCGATLWSRVRCRNTYRTGGAWRYGWLAHRESIDEDAEYEVAVVLEPDAPEGVTGILTMAIDDDPTQRITMSIDDTASIRITGGLP